MFSLLVIKLVIVLMFHRHLSSGPNRQTRYAVGAKYLRSLVNFEYFTNWQNALKRSLRQN